MGDSDYSGVPSGSLDKPACAAGWDFTVPTPEFSRFTLTLLPDVLSTQTPPER